MSALVRATANVLRGMYDETTGRFSSTTSAVDGRYVSAFSDPLSMRYSINSLLGLARAEKYERIGWDCTAATDLLLERNQASKRYVGDEGLLLSLLVEIEHADTDAQYAKVRGLAETVRQGAHPVLQDVAWLLSGLSAYAGVHPEARDAAVELYEVMRGDYTHPHSRFPLHVPTGRRSHLLSFGGLVYYLRALWDYAAAIGDERALGEFEDLVRRVIDRQGEWGEWPWLYHTATGQVAERYGLYSVHQEGMSMLFLLPAHSLGVSGTAEAIRRSYRWILGENELGVPMWRPDPLLVYRCIRRRLPVGNRLLRSMGGKPERIAERGMNFVRASLGDPARPSVKPGRTASLEINEECRSYEIGWTIFAWAGAAGFDEFTEAEMWQAAL